MIEARGLVTSPQAAEPGRPPLEKVISRSSRTPTTGPFNPAGQLQHGGLAGGRPVQGTFITGASSPALPGAQRDLRVLLEEWLRAAEQAGRSEEEVAVIAVARCDLRREKAR